MRQLHLPRELSGCWWATTKRSNSLLPVPPYGPISCFLVELESLNRNACQYSTKLSGFHFNQRYDREEGKRGACRLRHGRCACLVVDRVREQFRTVSEHGLVAERQEKGSAGIRKPVFPPLLKTAVECDREKRRMESGERRPVPPSSVSRKDDKGPHRCVAVSSTPTGANNWRA